MSIQVGQWNIKRLLGEGAFGRAYYGEHTILGDLFSVCIKEEKTGKKKYMEMFHEEAILLAKLRHFGLPTLLDYIEATNDIGQLMVLSFIPGSPLDKDVKNNGSIEDEHICWILDRVLAPLGYLHGKWEMVHCDIKPANIILDIPNHEAVVVDLGMATLKPDEVSKAKGGTPGYIPPEFALGYPPIPASDIYSVGKVGIFLATGDNKMVERGECPKDMHPELQEFIGKMVRRDSSRRPQDVDELRDELYTLRHKMFGQVTCQEVIKRRSS